MWFAGSQPNRLRKILKRGFDAVPFKKMDLAPVLPRLPETGVQPKGFIEEREPASGRACRRQLQSVVEHHA